MKFLSLCSGIEAASVAWGTLPCAPDAHLQLRGLGWEAVAFAEIEKFPSAVLAHHYPTVPNWGDMTKFKDWPDATFDVLVGGTPCQSFSVAGLRKGLADPRGNLALVYLGILDRYRPRWMVWENVPGVLSSNEGRDFGAFLGGLAELGYGFCYRVLDAQYFGLAQRRKRVFVVGYAGNWRRAAAVLFEPASLQGHPPPCREAREATAPTLSACTRGGGGLGTDFDCDGGLIADVSQTLSAARGKACAHDHTQETYVPIAFGGNNQSGSIDVATAQTAHGGTGRMDFETETFVAHAVPLAECQKRTGKSSTSLKAGDGIGDDGDPMFTLGTDSRHGVALCFDETQITSAENCCNPQPGDPSHPLAKGAKPPAIAFHARQDPDSGPVTHPLDTDGTSIGILQSWRVRRLTPRECERLQGFPDDYTAIPYRGKPAADGPRYKVLGNSMAVPVMRWIGERIAAIDAIPHPVTPASRDCVRGTVTGGQSNQ